MGESGGGLPVVGYGYWVGEGVLGGVGVVDDQHRSENLRIFCIWAAGRRAAAFKRDDWPFFEELQFNNRLFLDQRAEETLYTHLFCESSCHIYHE